MCYQVAPKQLDVVNWDQQEKQNLHFWRSQNLRHLLYGEVICIFTARSGVPAAKSKSIVASPRKSQCKCHQVMIALPKFGISESNYLRSNLRRLLLNSEVKNQGWRTWRWRMPVEHCMVKAALLATIFLRSMLTTEIGNDPYEHSRTWQHCQNLIWGKPSFVHLRFGGPSKPPGPTTCQGFRPPPDPNRTAWR